jgi:Uma2 family endonuclease
MATTTKLTLEQFLALPETEPASEYADGEVEQKTMPTGWHGMVQSLVAFFLTLYLREHPIGDGGSEVRCIFGPPRRVRTYVPDYIVVVRTDAGRQLTNGPFLAAPDLAVEILSPDDRMSKVMRKVRFYLANGVRLVWLIDPTARTVRVLTEPNVSLILRDEDILDGGDVLPGFSVPVRDILPPEPAPVTEEAQPSER